MTVDRKGPILYAMHYTEHRFCITNLNRYIRPMIQQPHFWLYLSKRTEIRCPKRDLYFHVYRSIIDNSQAYKQTKCPLTDGWIKKL